MKKVGLWVLIAVVTAGLGYSMAVISAPPAYADTVCEPEDCVIVGHIAKSVCLSHAGVNFVSCPENASLPNNYLIFCNDGYGTGSDCSNF
jgi:hypothetical protein